MTDKQWVENSGNTWKPEKKDDEVVGILVDIEKGVGTNNSTLYTIQEETTGENVSVWGSTILDSRMKGIPVGAEVKIIFKGFGDAKPGKNPPKLWKVLYVKE